MKVSDTIKSRDNNLLKHIRKLKAKKYREEFGEYIIEGLRLVEEAFFANAPLKYCLYSENLKGERALSLLNHMNERGVPLYTVEENLLKDACETQNPQGIAAVVEKKEMKYKNMPKHWDFIVMVDRIQDPGNLGTIIRTAHASGADALYMSEGTVDPYSPKVLRSTMGSIFHLPVIQCDDMVSYIEKVKSEGFKVYASSLEGSTEYYNLDYNQKTALIIGNEANGASQEILECADSLIKIPMPGGAESLNAAVAGGILMFEIVRQRNLDK